MMKIQIAKSNLQPALASCCTVVDTRSPSPIAACVVIDAAMGSVTLRSTNLYQTIERVTPALAVPAPGSVMVDATSLLKRIDALDDGEITIVETKGGIDIRQGSAKYALGKVTAPESVTTRPDPQGAEIDARAFGVLLGRMAPAMSQNEATPNVHAVKVVGKGGRLTAMATEGHLGAMASLTFDGEIDVLIPAPAVVQLKKVLSKIDGVTRLFVSGASLHVFSTGFAYSTLIAAADFPPLMSIIPARVGKSLKASRVEMMSAVKLVDIVGPADDRVHIRPSAGGFTVRGTSKEGATASREVNGTCDVQSSISSKFLLLMLDFLGGNDVTLWQEEGRRALDGGPDGMVSENADGDLIVVMPLRYDAEDLSADAAKD